MKKIGIMQPYFLPYIGYFQLINSVDEFVFYDDVNFIKQGWVNRNKILVNDKENLFTIPLLNASSFKLIKDTEIHPQLFIKWRSKFLKSINQSYNKAPYFDPVYSLLEQILNCDVASISLLAINSVEQVLNYLGENKNTFISSKSFTNSISFAREDRIIDICTNLEGEKYINAIGGLELYNKKYFQDRGIDLAFLKPKINTYKQFSNEFKGGLSIIDVLMFNSIEETKILLNKYELL